MNDPQAAFLHDLIVSRRNGTLTLRSPLCEISVPAERWAEVVAAN